MSWPSRLIAITRALLEAAVSHRHHSSLHGAHVLWSCTRLSLRQLLRRSRPLATVAA